MVAGKDIALCAGWVVGGYKVSPWAQLNVRAGEALQSEGWWWVSCGGGELGLACGENTARTEIGIAAGI